MANPEKLKIAKEIGHKAISFSLARMPNSMRVYLGCSDFKVYEADVVWDGRVRRILVDEADCDALVGMTLLKGYELRMQVRVRGKVTIQRLRRR